MVTETPKADPPKSAECRIQEAVEKALCHHAIRFRKGVEVSFSSDGGAVRYQSPDIDLEPSDELGDAIFHCLISSEHIFYIEFWCVVFSLVTTIAESALWLNPPLPPMPDFVADEMPELATLIDRLRSDIAERRKAAKSNDE